LFLKFVKIELKFFIYIEYYIRITKLVIVKKIRITKNHAKYWAKSPKQQSERVRFLLILRSKYSAILSKIHSTDCFFGNFAHWEFCEWFCGSFCEKKL